MDSEDLEMSGHHQRQDTSRPPPNMATPSMGMHGMNDQTTSTRAGAGAGVGLGNNPDP